jgi:ABC-2 type transport system permease protein
MTGAPRGGATTEVYSGAAASFWRVMAIARRHGYVLQRSPHRLFDVVVWPAVDVVLFGSIGVFAAGRAGGAASEVALYLLVGVVLWHVVYQAQIALATGFLEETWSRSVMSLMVTPMREWEYVAGVALFGMVKLVLGVGAVAVIAWFAYAFSITSLGLGLIPVAALLLAVGWAIALFVIGLVLRFGSGAEALAWGILFAVMPLSGTFYPVSALPGILRPIGEVLPTTHAFAAGRAFARGDPMPWHELGVATVGTAALLLVALAYLGWMLRVFRARGLVTRYS